MGKTSALNNNIPNPLPIAKGGTGAQTAETALSALGGVPYTGAGGSVDLGAFNITAESLIKAEGLSSQFLKGDGSVDSNVYLTTYIVTFVLSIGVDSTIGANKTNEIVIPRNSTITKVLARCKTAPTNAALIFDINKNGTSIWDTTQANRIQIAANAVSGTQTSFDTVSLDEGDILTIDIDQIGSLVAGRDITIEVKFTQ
jgi:hypothetical protein